MFIICIDFLLVRNLKEVQNGFVEMSMTNYYWIGEVMIKKYFLLVFCLFVFLGLAGCGTDTVKDKSGAEVKTCDLYTYKKSAQPYMQEFSDIVSELNIRDDASKFETKSELESLLKKINLVKCKSEFPLKHETLEYSIRHMIDAIDYANNGDYVEMNYSLEKAILNAETFQDWSVDVD